MQVPKSAMRTFMLAMTAFAFTAAARADEVRVVGVAAEGSEFKGTLADGRVLRSADLVGTVLRIAGEDIRIDAVERDPSDKKGSIWLHRLARRAPDGRWHDYCLAGPDGLRAGFPLAGRDRADGTLAPGGANDFIIVCSAGARGKCARFGYRPWAEAADGTSLRDVFNACVRM